MIFVFLNLDFPGLRHKYYFLDLEIDFKTCSGIYIYMFIHIHTYIYIYKCIYSSVWGSEFVLFCYAVL